MKNTIMTLLLHCLVLMLYGLAYVILHDGLPSWPLRSSRTGGRRHNLPSSTT